MKQKRFKITDKTLYVYKTNAKSVWSTEPTTTLITITKTGVFKAEQ
jgi:hypothetical protein